MKSLFNLFFYFCFAASGVASPPATEAHAVTRGREFLLRLMDPKLHLLPEFAGHNVIWLYHDNYLAAKVLAPTHPAEAAKIVAAIRSYGVERSGKIEMLFGEGKLPLRRYELRDVAKAGKFTIRSEFTTEELNAHFDGYADLLFFSAIAEPDAVKARAHFDTALAMWDGTGFNDEATRHHKIYATYKLALALRAARRFEMQSTALTAIRERLLKMQADSGGWITDYKRDGTPVGMANVETTSLAILVLDPALQSTNAAPDRKPNVILILADDLGFETIGANGGTSYRTPVLDKLAATGARFTHCYAQPLCTPTRVQLMTGRSNVRNYINFGNMDPNAVTFGNVFKQAGYATCIAGKWQLGHDPELPKKFGFDEHCLWQHTRRPPRYANPGLEINGVEKDFTNGEYGPDLVNDYAMDFIGRKKDAPFFLYYPMMLTHGPYQPTPDSKTWEPKAIGEQVNRRPEHFGDMVEYMDKLTGKLVAKLGALGLRENTLIVFLGDNGTGAGTRSQMGARTVIGRKGRTISAGMHVPLIVNWPGKVGAGRVCGDLVDTTDFLPTLCAASGVPLPQDMKPDGRSFFPQLRGEPGSPREWIYSWYSPRQLADRTVREFAFNQHYKRYRDGTFFDLTADIEEKQPLKVAELSGDAAAAAKVLQSALDQFKDARPASLDAVAPGEGPAKKRKAKQAELRD